jgi:hypothetical protein
VVENKPRRLERQATMSLASNSKSSSAPCFIRFSGF